MNAPRRSLRSQALTTLRAPDAPRVFSPSALRTWLLSHDAALPDRSLTQALAEWTDAGVLDRINNQVYLNLMAHPRPLPDEAAGHLRPGAVVSLTRVLGQAGVLNNPTSWVTSVVSIDKTRKVGEVSSPVAEFVFAALPESLLPPRDSALGQEAYEPGLPYLRATPEKAFLDLRYLQSTPRGAARWDRPVDADWDMEQLDPERLRRLAEGLQLQPLLPISQPPRRRFTP